MPITEPFPELDGLLDSVGEGGSPTTCAIDVMPGNPMKGGTRGGSTC